MKLDRGIIKWQPFNSVAPSKEIINKLDREKQKIDKPILSEEQLDIIQNNLFEAYNNELETIIKYYKNGIIFNEQSKIKVLDFCCFISSKLSGNIFLSEFCLSSTN